MARESWSRRAARSEPALVRGHGLGVQSRRVSGGREIKWWGNCVAPKPRPEATVIGASKASRPTWGILQWDPRPAGAHISQVIKWHDDQTSDN